MKKIIPFKDELRRQAEAKLSKQKTEKKKKTAPAPEINTQPSAKTGTTSRLIHELEVHQIELEMQNEQLIQSRAEAEAAYRQYADLFDFAPVGYFTLARDGAIHQVNSAGANLLGLERGKLIKRRFGVFVSAQSRAIFNAFLEKIFTSGSNETCEVALLKDVPVWARIEAILDQGQRETCRVVVSDISARVRAEEMLRESEMSSKKNNILLSSILESPFGMVIFALDTDFCYIAFTRTHKNTMKAIWGVEIELGMNMLDAINDPLDREKARKNFECAMRGEHFILIEEYGDPAIYRTFYEDRYSPIHDETGAIIGMTVFVTDITERKQAEEALKESKANLQAILASTDDIIASYDREIRLLTYNPACAKTYRNLFGVELRPGLRTLDLFPESMRGFWITNNARALAGESFSVELNMSTPDNRGRLFESHFNPIRNNGDVVGFSTFTRDITERKQAEESLRESEARFRVMFEQAAVGVAQLQTATGYFVSINQKYCDIVGYSRAEMEKINFQAITHEDDLKIDLANMELLKSGKIRKFSMEKRYYGKSGDTIWVNLTVSPMWAEGETPNYHIAIVEDITERKRAEAILQNIIDKNPMSIQIVDQEGFTLSVNLAHTKLFGAVPPSDYSIFNDFQLKQQGFGELLEHVKNGEVVHFPDLSYNAHALVSEFPDMPVWIRMIIFPLNNNAGKPERFVLMHEDITARKQLEDEIATAKARLEMIVTSSAVMLYASQAFGDFDATYISDNIGAIAGYTPQDFLSKGFWASHIHPEDAPKVFENISTLFEQNHYKNEYRFLFKDGAYHWMYDEVKLIRDDGGNPLEIIGTWADITARKQADESLRMMAEMLDTAPNAISVHDFNGRFLYTNRKCIQLHGYETDEFMALNLHDLDVPESETLIAERMQLVKEKGEAFFEVAHIRKDGTIFPMDVFVKLVEWHCAPAILSINTDITERKQAEEALRESQELFSLFMRHSPIYAYIHDVTPSESRVLQSSENYQQMLGISSQDMVGKTMAELFPPEFAAKITADDWFVISSGETLKLDEDFNGRNYTSIKFPIIQGDKTLLAGYTIDITERKQAEEKLQKSEASLRAIFENSIQSFLLIDLNRKIQSFNQIANERVVKTFGKEIHQGDSIYEMVVPRDQEDFDRDFQRALNGESVRTEKSFIAGAVELFYEFHYAPVRIDGQQVSGVFFSVTDITERKQAEDALQIAEASFRAIFENAPVGIFQSTPQGQFIRINPAMARIYGYDSPQDMVASITNISRQIYVNPSDRQRFQRSLAEHGEVLEFIDENYCKDQSIIWTQTNARAVKDAQGNILLYDGFITDITRRKGYSAKVSASGIYFRM